MEQLFEDRLGSEPQARVWLDTLKYPCGAPPGNISIFSPPISATARA